MAGFSIGEAIAMGITQGIGQGATKVQDERRQERLQTEAEARLDTRLVAQEGRAATEWTRQQEAQRKARAEEYKVTRADTVADQQTQFRQTQALQNQRQRFEVSQIAAQTQEAKKISLFNTNLSMIKEGVDANRAFTEWAKLDTGTIAQRISVQAAKGLPAELQKQAYQDTMGRLKGMTKQEMLGQAGLYPADLTPYLKDPQYKDAIPKGYIAGMQMEGIGMDQVFTGPQAQPQVSADDLLADQKANDQARIQTYADTALSAPALRDAGISGVSSSVLLQMDAKFGQGKVSPVEIVNGVTVNRPEAFIQQGINDGSLSLDPMTRQVIPTVQLRAQQVYAASTGIPVETPQAAGVAPDVSQGTQSVPPMLARPGMQAQPSQVPPAQPEFTPVPTGPTTEELALQAGVDKETAKLAGSLSTAVSKTKAIDLYEPVTRAQTAIANASPAVKDTVNGLLFDAGGNIANALRVARKATDPASKDAYMLLQSISDVHNTRVHELFGAALSVQEAARADRAMGQAGWIGSIEELQKGLDIIGQGARDRVVRELEGEPEEVRKAFLKEAPVVSEMLKEHPVYGKPAAILNASVAPQVEAAISAGTLTPEQSQEIGAILADVPDFLEQGGDIAEVKSILSQYGIK